MQVPRLTPLLPGCDCWRLQTFAEYLRGLDFEDAPDYDFLEELLGSWLIREQRHMVSWHLKGTVRFCLLSERTAGA